MKSRIQKPRTRVTKNTRTEVIEDRKTRTEREREALERGLDELLADIDEALEGVDQDMAQKYTQKGGE